MDKPTTVVNVRGLSMAELRADPDFLYVGRYNPLAGAGSIWANPWRVGDPHPERNERLTVEECLRLYETVTLQSGLIEHVDELRGKRLGCWCCDYDGVSQPEPKCHAAILARLANGLEPA